MSNTNNRKGIVATFVCVAIVLLLALLIMVIVQNVYADPMERTIVELNNLFIYKYVALNFVNLTTFIALYIILWKKITLKVPMRIMLSVAGYAFCAVIIRLYI